MTGGGGSGTAGALAYTPCDEAKRLGQFSFTVNPTVGSTAQNIGFGGAVRDKVDPRKVRVEIAKEGSCRLIKDPAFTCATSCAPMICVGTNQCAAEPKLVDVGIPTITGLSGAATILNPGGTNQYYSADITKLTFPGVSPNADVTLSVPGAGSVSAFALSGRGITPLDFPGANIQVSRNKEVPVTWTAPASSQSTHIFVRLEIAHHGGGTAKIECDVPDTGTATIPASLVTQLIDLGTAGFPALSLTRQTVDSKAVGAGCVEFLVASPVERIVTVEGSVSCNCETDIKDSCTEDPALPCPTGQTCLPAGVPNGRTCAKK